MRLCDADFSVEAIGFNMGEPAKGYRVGDTVDIVFTPEINTWNNTERIQFNLRDIKPCIYAELDKIIVFNKSNDYNIYIDPQNISRLIRRRGVRAGDLVPERNELEVVYRYLRACGKTGGEQLEFGDYFELSARISAGCKARINYFKLKMSLEIFNELGLLSMRAAGQKTALRLKESAGKVELESSRVLTRLRELRDGFCPANIILMTRGNEDGT